MRQLNADFSVRTVLLESGERLPMLIENATGVPLFEPTVYSLMELRARNRAAATIEQALRAVMVLHVTLARLGIDLAARLAERQLLQTGEIEAVMRACRYPLTALWDESYSAAPYKAGASRGRGLERYRMKLVRAPAVDEEVDPGTLAIRLYYVRDYLRWRVDRQMLKLSGSPTGSEQLASLCNTVLRAFANRVPISRQDLMTARQGLSEQALARLKEVIQPASSDNPWKGGRARERNALIVRWFLELGLRRGELLGVRVEDISFQSHEVRIHRRADDPEDPRRMQPNAKTLARLLPLTPELTQLTHQYIIGQRRSLAGARRHSFLFCALGTGKPMALSALTKLFRVLRDKHPELPPDLSAHVLRHTWNDQFSTLMDRRSVPKDVEEKLRSRLMGWSETSGTATVYTRRHVQKAAREASLELQRGMTKERSDGE